MDLFVHWCQIKIDVYCSLLVLVASPDKTSIDMKVMIKLKNSYIYVILFYKYTAIFWDLYRNYN